MSVDAFIQYALQKLQTGDTAEATKILKSVSTKQEPERLNAIMAEITHLKNQRDLKDAITLLVEDLLGSDESLKAVEVLNSTPNHLQTDPELRALRLSVLKQTQHTRDPKLYKGYYQSLPFTETGVEDALAHARAVPRFAAVLSILKNRYPRGAKVLDVGCNEGFLSLLLASEGYDVTGIDLGNEALEVAKRRAIELDLTARFVYGNVSDFSRETYDVVIACEVIEHVPDLNEFMADLERQVDSKGLVIFSSPHGTFDYGLYDLFQHTRPKDEYYLLRGHVRALTLEQWMQYVLYERKGSPIEASVLSDRMAVVAYQKTRPNSLEFLCEEPAYTPEYQEMLERVSKYIPYVVYGAETKIADGGSIHIHHSYFDPLHPREIVHVYGDCSFTDASFGFGTLYRPKKKLT